MTGPTGGKSVRAPERVRILSHCLQKRDLSLLGESCGERCLGKGGRDVRGQGTGASVASVRDGGGICQPLTRPPSETES